MFATDLDKTIRDQAIINNSKTVMDHPNNDEVIVQNFYEIVDHEMQAEGSGSIDENGCVDHKCTDF